MEGLRKLWGNIVGYALIDMSEEEQAVVYPLLEDAYKIVHNNLKPVTAAGFIESVFEIYVKTKCREPEITYNMFTTLVAGDPPQPLPALFDGLDPDHMLNDFEFLVSIFVDAYCGSVIALKQHPSYMPHIEGKELIGYN
jgi:hypothetical protein